MAYLRYHEHLGLSLALDGHEYDIPRHQGRPVPVLCQKSGILTLLPRDTCTAVCNICVQLQGQLASAVERDNVQNVQSGTLGDPFHLGVEIRSQALEGHLKLPGIVLDRFPGHLGGEIEHFLIDRDLIFDLTSQLQAMLETDLSVC